MNIILGFIPLLDSASLVVAAERGFAAQEGIELTLVRETSWANIRDRLIIGHFDAAHLLGPMAVASTLGIGHVRVPLIAPFALGRGGNAITASLRLWEQMERAGAVPGGHPRLQGAALERVVAARNSAHLEPLTFGMVYPFSCHNYELRYWLAASGIDPNRDVRLVVIPPPFLVDALRAGQIDGFCVGEPWNSVAVNAGAGVIVTATTAIWPMSPEKVLGCRPEWAQRHPMQLASLLRALYRASQWCEQAENHADLAQLLAQPRYVGAPAELLRRGLENALVLRHGSPAAAIPDFYVPAARAATFPWVSHALWFYSQMVRWRQIEFSAEYVAAARATYRPDLYRAALGSVIADIPVADVQADRFFDGTLFDAGDLTAP
ncbi:MAG TPA: CmpA/NrtA family ABC transporter substrate-binding protein [Steroidobacteraceae bacterium]|nr:CmpA/NrtA family ABC transporter substrate-binding protein [Steroidobacteraceae bacterium]